MDVALALALLVGAAALNLASVAAVNTSAVLTAEEVSVSVLDVVALPAHLQPTVFATNFGGHVTFWIFSHLDPSFDLFYGRDWKALAMALLGPLVYLTLRRRLDCARGPAFLGGATVVLLPGVTAFAWLATENGFEGLWGLVALLLVSSSRRVWVLAPIPAGIAVSTYGAGLAWAAAVLVVAAVRLVRSRRPWAEAAGLLVATAAGVLIVLFPVLWWWEGGGRVVVGGGSIDDPDPGGALAGLARELAVLGDSYYYFSTAPALGSLWLAILCAVALVVATVWRPRIWPWTLVVLLTVALYAVSGGVLGVRRTIALPVVAALCLAVLVDLLLRRVRGPGARLVLALVTAGAVLAPLAVQYADWRARWAEGREVFPVDFAFPLAAGRTMPEEVAAITERLRSGTTTVEEIASEREGERSLSMVWLIADRRGEDLAGLPTPREILELVFEGPRCPRDCRPVPGRP